MTRDRALDPELVAMLHAWRDAIDTWTFPRVQHGNRLVDMTAVARDLAWRLNHRAFNQRSSQVQATVGELADAIYRGKLTARLGIRALVLGAKVLAHSSSGEASVYALVPVEARRGDH